MSFLKKMFGKKDPVEELQQLYARQEWAGVLSVARNIKLEELPDDVRKNIAGWTAQAGDALAAINIDEGQWAQKAGNLLRAREDFQLALELAGSDELRQRAQQALAALEKGELLPEKDEQEINTDGPAIHAGCNTCTSTTHAPAVSTGETDLDEEAREPSSSPPFLSTRTVGARPTTTPYVL